MFKKGEWIVITLSPDNWAQGMSDKVGKCVQLTEDTHGDGDRARFKGCEGYAWNYRNRHYRRAEAHEIPPVGRHAQWCVRVTKENKEYIESLRGGCMIEGYISCDKYNNPWGGLWHPKHPGYPELTIEQFKEQVMGEKPNQVTNQYQIY